MLLFYIYIHVIPAQASEFAPTRQSREEQALHLFKPFPKKLGWKANPSIVTDGVSVSISYTKEIPVKIKDNSSKKAKQEKIICETYNPNEDTILGDTLILGVDPGRVSLVSCAYVKDGKLHKSAYKRTQYYNDARIMDNTKKINNWDSAMKPHWANLIALGGSHKANMSGQLLIYIGWNHGVEDEWFALRFKRKYQREKFSMYGRKRSALDSYTSSLKKELEATMARQRQSLEMGKGKGPPAVPLLKIQVAYGACGPKMRPSGTGELSVPTTGMYRSFQRAFKKKNVVLTNEFNTTKVSWDTQLDKEKVYIKPRLDGKKLLLDLYHTNAKYLPKVRDDEMPAFKADQERRFRLRRKQREATGEREPKIPDEPRHTEVRGLRFCTRKRIFLDRDVTAARAIAGLRKLEMEGKGRPARFSTQKNSREPSGEPVSLGSTASLGS